MEEVCAICVLLVRNRNCKWKWAWWGPLPPLPCSGEDRFATQHSHAHARASASRQASEALRLPLLFLGAYGLSVAIEQGEQRIAQCRRSCEQAGDQRIFLVAAQR